MFKNISLLILSLILVTIVHPFSVHPFSVKQKLKTYECYESKSETDPYNSFFYIKLDKDVDINVSKIYYLVMDRKLSFTKQRINYIEKYKNFFQQPVITMDDIQLGIIVGLNKQVIKCPEALYITPTHDAYVQVMEYLNKNLVTNDFFKQFKVVYYDSNKKKWVYSLGISGKK